MRVLAEFLALLIVACSPLGSPVAPDAPGDWRASDGREYPILEVREGRDLLLGTPLGPLRVDWAVGLQDGAARLGDLDRLLTHARDEGLDLQELTLYRTALAGSYLYSLQLVVLPEGVLVASDPEVLRARASEQHERALVVLRRAVERVAASLERRETDHASRFALLQILAQLGEKDDASGSFDILEPSFARRLVRHDWLALLDVEETARVELEAAVLEAESLRPLNQYASARSRLVYSEDAFGRGAWVLSTPERSGYSRLAPPPA